MKATKILNSDIEPLKVSSLPTRPTAPISIGGMGYSAREMKEAFDKLPLFIIERFNDLIDDVTSSGGDSFSASISTGLKADHTLNDMFTDISSGEFGAYFKIFGESLTSHLISIKAEISSIKERLEAIDSKAKEESDAEDKLLT